MTTRIVGVCFGAFLAAGAFQGVSTADDCSGGRKNIVETARAAGGFDTLIAAAEAADLVGVLTSDGPLTVFAPTDEAFGKLPKGTLQTLMKNPERLAAVLKYHVVPGRVMAADVMKRSSAKTALGQELAIDTSSAVRVNDATVIKADVLASNGVIHVIDSVLLPRQDILSTARSAGTFQTLLAVVEAAGLADALGGDGPLTLFAPTDEAFSKLPAGTVERLLKDVPKLRAILTYHVVQGRVMAADVMRLQTARTLQGQSVRIRTSSDVMINDARVIQTDLPASNGVIHVIDTVLLPS